MFGSARVFTSTSFHPKTKLRGEAKEVGWKKLRQLIPSAPFGTMAIKRV